MYEYIVHVKLLQQNCMKNAFNFICYNVNILFCALHLEAGSNVFYYK